MGDGRNDGGVQALAVSYPHHDNIMTLLVLNIMPPLPIKARVDGVTPGVVLTGVIALDRGNCRMLDGTLGRC